MESLFQSIRVTRIGKSDAVILLRHIQKTTVISEIKTLLRAICKRSIFKVEKNKSTNATGAVRLSYNKSGCLVLD